MTVQTRSSGSLRNVVHCGAISFNFSLVHGLPHQTDGVQVPTPGDLSMCISVSVTFILIIKEKRASNSARRVILIFSLI